MKSSTPVWLIDDDRIDGLTISRGFVKNGISNPLVIFTSALKALESLRMPEVEKPGIILLDLKMPQMDGIEFLQVLKHDEALKKIPVIVLTTSQNPGDKLAAFDLQVAGYFVKPMDFFEIADVLSKYWGNSELPRI